jgi:hypothetical protein
VRPHLVGIRVLEFDKIEEAYAQAQPAMAAFQARLQDLFPAGPS